MFNWMEKRRNSVKKQDHMQGLSTFNFNKSQVSIRCQIKNPGCCDFIKKLLILLTTHEWVILLVVQKFLSRLKLSHLFASYSTPSTKNSLNSLSRSLARIQRIYSQKSLFSIPIYFYTHIWCAHMRWWCCIAAMRDAKNKKKETILNLNSPQELVISLSNLLRSLFFFVNIFPTEISSNSRRNVLTMPC